jgi:hypothetical protein
MAYQCINKTKKTKTLFYQKLTSPKGFYYIKKQTYSKMLYRTTLNYRIKKPITKKRNKYHLVV